MFIPNSPQGMQRTMNLRHMEVFHAIMRTGSVTGAARALNVTQPAVSAILKHCEGQLKMKLFARVSGRLQPTAEAKAIFPEIDAIFGRVDAVNALTQDLVGGRLGTLSVAAAFPIANGYLAKAVAVRDLEPYSIITYLPQALSRIYVDRALSAAGIVPNIVAQVSLSLTGIMLARHGAGVALVEPLLVASMGLPGVVTRPLKPRIDVKTLLIRHKTAPQSKIMNEFVGHLGRVIAAEPTQ